MTTVIGMCGPNEDLGCIDRELMINNHSQVTGRVRGRAFLWENGSMRTLGTFGGPESDPYDLNEHGQVVGWADTSVTSAYDLHDTHAFLWRRGQMRDLGTLGGPESVAYDINERGQVVGWADTKAGVYHAVLWQSGKTRDLGAGPESKAVAINERGQVLIESGKGLLLWQNGKLLNLGLGVRVSDARDLNEPGQVLAKTEEAPDRLVLWTNGKARLVTTKHTLGVAVDERGRVIGTLWLNDIKDHLFMWEKNRVRLIGVGGFEAMNERGQVVGATQLDTPRPLLWEGGTRTLLPLRSGDKYGSALGLNARNQIVGWSGNSFHGDPDEVYKGRLVLWTLKR